LNGKRQFLAYFYDVNLLMGNIDTINKSTETVIDAGKEIGLEGKAEKTVGIAGHVSICVLHVGFH
jgi:hypothetical protein